MAGFSEADTCVLPAISPRPAWPERPGTTELPPCSRESAASPSAATAGGCLSFLSPFATRSFPSLCGFKGGSTMTLTSWQSPSHCPTPAGARKLGRIFFPLRARGKAQHSFSGWVLLCSSKAPLEPCGCQALGDLPGGLWCAPVGMSPARVSCGFPPPHGSCLVRPQVVPTLSVLGRAPQLLPAPRLQQDSASRIPSRRDVGICRETVQEHDVVLPLPFLLFPSLWCFVPVASLCCVIVWRLGEPMTESAILCSFWPWGRGSLELGSCSS